MARREVTVVSHAAGDAIAGSVGTVEAQPRLGHHVLGIGNGAEHPVGQTDQS